ncbi:MAG: hypothetical protein ACSHXJ_04105 [Marinomonas colpomeniae]|uniref:Uncharacterized protein n=2 Tax=Marinomonas colpomeniae TaxID=2774408 RepID=A0ABR8NZ24_9GAMM|nr:hypothetical protein [Marinomonas colpomeniae]
MNVISISSRILSLTDFDSGFFSVAKKAPILKLRMQRQNALSNVVFLFQFLFLSQFSNRVFRLDKNHILLQWQFFATPSLFVNNINVKVSGKKNLGLKRGAFLNRGSLSPERLNSDDIHVLQNYLSFYTEV